MGTSGTVDHQGKGTKRIAVVSNANPVVDGLVGMAGPNLRAMIVDQSPPLVETAAGSC